MTTYITRLYETKKNADDAVAALRKLGFVPSEIRVVEQADAAAIVASGAPAADAAIYAQELTAGRALITVEAPPQRTFRARNGLAAGNPIPSKVTTQEHFKPLGGSGEASMLSTVLGIPLLLNDKSSTQLLGDGTYFSDIFGLPTIIKSGKPLLGGLLSSDFTVFGFLPSKMEGTIFGRFLPEIIKSK